MKKLIPLFLTVLLTGCGGGGGGSGSPAPVSAAHNYVSAQGYTGFGYSVATGKFDGVNNYVVTGGWLGSNSPSSLPTTAPIKVYKVTSTGLTDATTQILGSEVNWTVNYPIVADFNNDGIDDIFLGGFMDVAPFNYKSAVFISHAGHAHTLTEFATPTYNHGITSGDLDNDGDIDVVNSVGDMWINDGVGNFTFKAGLTWGQAPTIMHGNGVCVADFNNTGHSQVLITDLYLDSNAAPIADTVIFELDSNLNPTTTHTLPVPYFDRGNSGAELSHDVSCIVNDVNNDGKPDVFVVSGYNGGGKQSALQLYINQGNFVFTDATDTNIVNYNHSMHSSYTPMLIDYNGDGVKDLWLKNFDWSGSTSNQLFVNNGSGVFTQTASVTNITAQFNTESNADPGTTGPAVPIKIGSTWYLVVTSITNGVLNLAIKPYL